MADQYQQQMPSPINPFYYKNFSPRTKFYMGLAGTVFLFINIILFRLIFLISRERPETDGKRSKPPKYPTHLLVVLGSGGHTTEMLDMLRKLPLSPSLYHFRTYIVSSGDGFSAAKAAEFEKQLLGQDAANYSIVTVTRARKIHQTIFTTPFTASLCLLDCIRALLSQPAGRKGTTKIGYPDLILTNGPGTGLCVILASLILRFFRFSGPRGMGSDHPADTAQMRTIFIESWARVTSLSLTGKIILPVVDRYLVQWPELAGKGDKTEYVGTLVA